MKRPPVIRQLARAVTVSIFASIVCLALPLRILADASPSTRPATPIQTGETDLTFNERSPLSAPAEIARRLKVTPDSLGDDYDLSKRPFKAYIPTNYDPAIPYGLFVYLGYKNTVSSPPLWRPVLEKHNLIFISPVCHSGIAYAPTVPMWQSIGVALDAVYNCGKQFNIDPHRIYLMSWGSGSSRTSYCVADAFTGFIVTYDPEYSSRINLPGGSYYPPAFTPPPPKLMTRAKDRAFVFIDDGSPDNVKMTGLVLSAMRRDDFSHLMMTGLSPIDDLHFPNLKADWFEQQVLPFLDKASETVKIANSALNPPSTQSAAPVVEVSAAQHLLAMARLYIGNGQTELARGKLQQIIDNYPTDPAADTAKQLLSQMNQ